VSSNPAVLAWKPVLEAPVVPKSVCPVPDCSRDIFVKFDGGYGFGLGVGLVLVLVVGGFGFGDWPVCRKRWIFFNFNLEVSPAKHVKARETRFGSARNRRYRAWREDRIAY
jgi:hypothetical protein